LCGAATESETENRTMSLIDRLLGRDEPPAPNSTAPAAAAPRFAQNGGPGRANLPSADEQAVARYRYMLQTAPPETIEQAHEEAFARLTPEQRRLALQQLATNLPENERAFASEDDPRTLARLATRAEVRQPGFMERTFGGGGMGAAGGMMGGGMMGGGGGVGMGGLLAGGLLTSIAGSFIGSSIAHQFFASPDVTNNFYQNNPDMAGGENADVGDNLAPDNAADFSGGEQTVADASGAGDFGDFGGDAGGDFGGDAGGDFGGDV